MQMMLKSVMKNFIQRTRLDFMMLKPISICVSGLVEVDMGNEGLP